MCGITGFYAPLNKELLNTMTSMVSHRGPDQHGYFCDEIVSMGHRRLSIIDLSEDGKQPMSNEDGTVQLVFNGEIYNYQELRLELLKRGHTFKSKTDTEVIVHAYEEYGEECVQKFNGCFAFAIYDTTKKTLLLARDRLGIKPLYYHIHDDRLYFASEIQPLLKVPGFKREVNLKALTYYLSFFANSLAETMFSGIYKLPAGHILRFDGNLHIEKYWNITMNPLNISEDVGVGKLQSLLSDAVGKRLMSDVPLGVYLSGGVDSGSIVALMSRFTKNIKTFSVGFDVDGQRSELARARELASYFKTDHHEIILTRDAIKELPSIIWHQGEPMGDPTSIPTFLLSKEAKKKVTVVLTGEGADEQFAGYEQEKFMSLWKRFLAPIPSSFRKTLVAPLRFVPARFLNIFFSYMGDLGEEGKKRALNFVSSSNPTSALLSMISIFSEKEKRKVLHNSTLTKLGGHDVELDIEREYFKNAKTSSHNLLNKLLLFENKVLLTENLLMKVDKNTMAHGIEARVPFLDHRVVEFAAQLPSSLKLHGFHDKYILRKTMEKHLPAKRHAQKKQRFFVPIHHWLRSELKPLMKDLFSEEFIKNQGIFEHSEIQRIVHSYDSSPLFYARQIWTLLTFQIWYRMFIEEKEIKV